VTGEERARFEVLLEQINTKVNAIAEGQEGTNERLDHLVGRMERVENRLDLVEMRLGGVERRLGRIEKHVGLNGNGRPKRRAEAEI
jgi:archaellum component FlaC